MSALSRSRLEGPALFSPGRIVATPGFIRALADAGGGHHGVGPLRRHLTGDWGDLCAEDKRLNDRALKEGDRLLSAYRLPTGIKFYIITEADRSATTYLLPEEY